MTLHNNLTDAKIKSAIATDKPLYLFDGGGLYLEITPSGGKLWRMKYRFNGKGKILAFGKYPEVSLAMARNRRIDARRLLENEQDPGEVKKAQKAAKAAVTANSFRAVAEKWFKVWEVGKSEGYKTKGWAYLEKAVFPYLGNKPVSEIDRDVVLGVCEPKASRGFADAAHRVKSLISMVLQHAVRSRLIAFNPCIGLGADLPKKDKKHYAAITDPQKLAGLLRKIELYGGRPVTCAALKLAPMLLVRVGELRHAEWSQINLEEGTWTFTTSKTKTPHIVPLARQAVAILRDLYPLTGHGRLVFPGEKTEDEPFSPETINRALQRMGYDTQEDITGHGFRATAATMLAERLQMPIDWIERQLAHRVPGALADTYQRSQYLDKRRPMMQAWADYLDSLKAVVKVIPMRPEA
ncbi:MAG: integrase arm-type DNA-binding domain-containing protein [Zoogloeaceae bacterium]|nr:integrase arm-type DNA-binding domain-containing protein [Zoogloeaceae bacterium]